MKPRKPTTKAAKPAPARAKPAPARAAARGSAAATNTAIDVPTEAEAESTAAAMEQAELGLAVAGNSADINGEKGTDAALVEAFDLDSALGDVELGGADTGGEKAADDEIEQTETDAGNSPADANEKKGQLTEDSLRRHRDSLPDRCPSRSTYWGQTAASLVPGETYVMPETQEPRLEENLTCVSPMAEKAPSFSSVLDTLPPGSEAGLSTTASSFDPRSATRSVASTKSCGDLEEINPLCTKCGFPTDVFNAVMKSKGSETQHAKYVCRPCNAIQTMVFRNLKQEGALRMVDWDDEQLQDFFRRAQEAHGKKDGRMKWAVVRDAMKKVLVKRLIESTEKKMKTEYKPLGVWEKLGYNAEMIAAYNRTNSQ